MGVLILALGMITIFCITMAGAIAGLMGQVPEASFLSILGHYTGHDREFSHAFTWQEGVAALSRIKRLLAFSVLGFVGGGLAALFGALVTGCRAAYGSSLALGVLAFNLVVLRAVINSWLRRLRR